MILAIDPGHQGGAVLLDDHGSPVAWWAWRKLRRKEADVYGLDYSRPIWGDRRYTRTLAGIGGLLALDVARWGSEYHLVAEGLFVHPKWRGDTAIDLGKSVGWLTAGLLETALSYEEPRADIWRPAVLGCRNREKSEVAERLALQLWASRWQGEPCDSPHVAEAYAMGWWRHTRRAA